MKGKDVNWGGLLCTSSSFFAVMVVINQSVNRDNSGIYALISLVLAVIAIPFVLKVEAVKVK